MHGVGRYAGYGMAVLGVSGGYMIIGGLIGLVGEEKRDGWMLLRRLEG